MIEIFWIDRFAMVIATLLLPHHGDAHEYLRTAKVAMLIGIDAPAQINHGITNNREPQTGAVWFGRLAGKPDIALGDPRDTGSVVGHGKRKGIILDRC